MLSFGLGVDTQSHLPLQGGRPLKYQSTIYSATVKIKLEMGSEVRQQKRAEKVILIVHEHPDFPPPLKIAGAALKIQQPAGQ